MNNIEINNNILKRKSEFIKSIEQEVNKCIKDNTKQIKILENDNINWCFNEADDHVSLYVTEYGTNLYSLSDLSLNKYEINFNTFTADSLYISFDLPLHSNKLRMGYLLISAHRPYYWKDEFNKIVMKLNEDQLIQLVKTMTTFLNNNKCKEIFIENFPFKLKALLILS